MVCLILVTGKEKGKKEEKTAIVLRLITRQTDYKKQNHYISVISESNFPPHSISSIHTISITIIITFYYIFHFPLLSHLLLPITLLFSLPFHSLHSHHYHHHYNHFLLYLSLSITFPSHTFPLPFYLPSHFTHTIPSITITIALHSPRILFLSLTFRYFPIS